MGGRGASAGLKGNGSRNGPVSANQTGIQNGPVVKITFPGNDEIEADVQFKATAAKDAGMSAAARKSTESWEKKRLSAKIEYAMAYDANGNAVIRERRGGSGSVKTPYAAHNTPGGVFTHNHPRDNGELGGTFSTADITNFTLGTTQTSRAAAKEGTYSISKASGFDGNGLDKYYRHEEAKARNAYETEFNKIQADFNKGIINYQDAKKKANREFNSYLINLHNILVDGQKTYGYTYALEK